MYIVSSYGSALWGNTELTGFSTDLTEQNLSWENIVPNRRAALLHFKTKLVERHVHAKVLAILEEEAGGPLSV